MNIEQPLPLVVKRLCEAMNQHDLEALLDCFDRNYHSEQPAHPQRTFDGSEQVRKNWSQVFSSIPDFQADLLRFTVEGDVEWSEWHWQGTQENGTRLNMRGVMILGIQNGRVTWGRLYMEPIEEESGDINANVANMTKRSA
jgi:ketosteroid isomerase-like protein